MRKTALRIFLICGAAALLFMVLDPPGSHVINSPLIRQMSAMRQIGNKISNYSHSHSATETESLRDKSIDDLVFMKCLSAADAAYLRDHRVKFLGYDSDHIAHDVPLLEALYPPDAPRRRIVVYSDISVVTSITNP